YRPQLEILEDRVTPASPPVTFAALGDYGSASSVLQILNTVLGAPDSEGDVARLVHSWNPDFVVTMGDNNYLCGEKNDVPLLPLLNGLVEIGDISPTTAQIVLDTLAPLFANVVTQNGVTTTGNAVITGLDTSQLQMGMFVVGGTVEVTSGGIHT